MSPGKDKGEGGGVGVAREVEKGVGGCHGVLRVGGQSPPP